MHPMMHTPSIHRPVAGYLRDNPAIMSHHPGDGTTRSPLHTSLRCSDASGVLSTPEVESCREYFRKHNKANN